MEGRNIKKEWLYDQVKKKALQNFEVIEFWWYRQIREYEIY